MGRMMTHVLRGVLTGCLAWWAGGVSASADGPDRSLLPEHIASTYVGLFSPHSEEGIESWIERVLDPMEKAGFNAFHCKIQPSGRGAQALGLPRHAQIDLSHPAQYERIRALSEACAERGIALIAYTYHYPHGGRHPERHAEYPPRVLADGTVDESQFAWANRATFRLITSALFELAKASRTLPIAAVGFDHEHARRGVISYDDEAWTEFAEEHDVDAELPAEERGPWIAAQGMADTYNEWYARRWDAIVRDWVADIHAINPYLSIAVMPMHGRQDNWFALPFFRHMGTEKAPAIIDSWNLYNGSGLTNRERALHDFVRSQNPHNRYVEWFRSDSYRAEDLRVHAYHLLREFGGYCSGSVWHIVPDRARVDDPAAYWAAYGEANHAFFANPTAAEPAIPFEPVTPRVAQMPELDDPVPQLTPHGDGSGEDVWIPLRNIQQFLIHAEAGEALSGEIRHLAGSARPLAVQYKMTNPDGSWLYDNTVPPGETRSFSVRVPETGTYALYVTGGEGGQAWYAVKIHNPWHTLPFAPVVDIRGSESTPYLFYPPSEADRYFPLTLWLLRSDPAAEATLRVGPGRGAVRLTVGDEPPVVAHRETVVANIPAGKPPVSFTMGRPDAADIEGPFRMQNLRIGVGGAVWPFLWVSPERLLLPADAEFPEKVDGAANRQGVSPVWSRSYKEIVVNTDYPVGGPDGPATEEGQINRQEASVWQSFRLPDGQQALLVTQRWFRPESRAHRHSTVWLPSLFTTSDGITFIRHPDSPLIKNPVPPWAGSRRAHPILVFDDTIERWYLYYSGGENSLDIETRGGFRSTGVAWSDDDMQSWEEPSPNVPLLTGSHPAIQAFQPGADRIYVRQVIYNPADNGWWFQVRAQAERNGPYAGGWLRGETPLGPWTGGPWNPTENDGPFEGATYFNGAWYGLRRSQGSSPLQLVRSVGEDFRGPYEEVGEPFGPPRSQLPLKHYTLGVFDDFGLTAFADSGFSTRDWSSVGRVIMIPNLVELRDFASGERVVDADLPAAAAK